MLGEELTPSSTCLSVCLVCAVKCWYQSFILCSFSSCIHMLFYSSVCLSVGLYDSSSVFHSCLHCSVPLPVLSYLRVETKFTSVQQHSFGCSFHQLHVLFTVCIVLWRFEVQWLLYVPPAVPLNSLKFERHYQHHQDGGTTLQHKRSVLNVSTITEPNTALCSAHKYRQRT